MLRSRTGRRLRLGLRLGRDLAGDVEADQADQDDGHAILVQQQVPWLAERDDAKHHQDLRARLQIFLVDPTKAHLRIAPKVTPRSRWLRSRNVKIATGSRNRNVPAAMTVQSGRP